MRQFFSWDGPMLRGLDKIGNLVIASLLWLVCSLPMVTMGLATTALYYTVVKVVRHERDSLLRQYYEALRREWKQGLILGGLYLLAFALIMFDVIAWREEGTKLGLFLFLVCTAALVILAVGAVYTFSLLSRFELATKEVLKISYFLAFRFLPSSLVIALVLGLSCLLLYLIPYTVLIVPGAACICISYFTEKIFRSITPEAENGLEQWYDDDGKEEHDANQETV